MGSFLHPVGSLPPGAYWFRRAVVGIVVLLLGGGGGWLLISGLGGSDSSGHPPSSTASGTPSSTPSSTPTSTASKTPSSTPTVSHSPTSTPITTCPDSVIRVDALTDSSSYAAGAKPHLTVSVTNTGKVSCKRDIGRAAMSLLITTGTTRVWSSDDCAPGGQPAVNTLKPGQVFSSTVIWNRSSSKPGCPSGQTAAAPGTYKLVAKNLTLKSGPVTFVLH